VYLYLRPDKSIIIVDVVVVVFLTLNINNSERFEKLRYARKLEWPDKAVM